jgi:hypothetical protein
MEQMPVKSMNTGWRMSQERRKAPGNPSFRGMRVHDMRPEPPHFGYEDANGTNVIAQPHAAAK